MAFYSILFKKNEDQIKDDSFEVPDFFVNLNLDRIINSVLKDKEEYNLKPYFLTSLKNTEAVKYRQEIMYDLENETLLENIKKYVGRMMTIHRYTDYLNKLYYKYHVEGWFLEIVEIYYDAVNNLVNDLKNSDIKSEGLLSFREYIISYAGSEVFLSLISETKKIKEALFKIKYCLILKDKSIKIRKYQSEIDFNIDIEKTFEKFKRGNPKDYISKLPSESRMNHIEAEILDKVAKLNPKIFLSLDNYYKNYNNNYMDKTISIFEREIQFYISYLDYISKFKKAGLKFCYPRISKTDKEIYNYEGFDLALADKLSAEKSEIVCNDFYLKDKERIMVVSGPNQGGKTTFARAFAQMHFLASLGCPVPGKKAKLFFYDNILTHFEKEENVKNLRGKLQDDLVRIYEILNKATSNSIVIMNEIFSSTTLHDAIILSEKIMEKLIKLDLICIWVSFIDELADFSKETVSLVSAVDIDNPALRTFKIVRKQADGLSYAISIAEKHKLTYECLKERIK